MASLSKLEDRDNKISGKSAKTPASPYDYHTMTPNCVLFLYSAMYSCDEDLSPWRSSL